MCVCVCVCVCVCAVPSSRRALVNVCGVRIHDHLPRTRVHDMALVDRMCACQMGCVYPRGACMCRRPHTHTHTRTCTNTTHKHKHTKQRTRARTRLLWERTEKASAQKWLLYAELASTLLQANSTCGDNIRACAMSVGARGGGNGRGEAKGEEGEPRTDAPTLLGRR